MTQIIDYYDKAINVIPEPYRLPVSIIVLVFLIFALISFMKKNLVWMVIFILLLPASYPALKQVYFALHDLFGKIPK